MKKYKQLLFILSIMIFLFSFNVHRIYADEQLTPSEIGRYNSYDYVIDSYDVYVIVNEDNTFDITETITAYFHVPKHGIIRSIPLKNTVKRLDGTTSKNNAYVSNVSVNNEYKTSTKNSNYEIQIGSANRTVTGKQTYVIKYQYDIGNDPLENYDELYFNIIGNEWDTVIGNITFTIEMPKEFDESKLGFSAGYTGSINSKKVSYTVDGTKITGSYQEILMAQQALTVRCELPEGYFTKSVWKSYDYFIDSYDVHMIVNEDNTFDITETITAYFREPKHGIIKSIPLKNTVERLDGTTSENKAYVSNVSVNDKYKTSKNNDNYEIQIGSANRTVTGKQTYVINYKYGIGNDPSKDYDELYFNIIGSEWDTVIGNITFTIEMPKEFDESKLGFSAGNVGSTNSENISYTVDGTKITGSYQEILSPGQALTVRCELPEGYFTKSFWKYFFFSGDYMYFLPIVSLAICGGIYLNDKKKYPIIKTVEFYPPEGLNSLYVGFLYKKGANINDVTSLLIYLANKGYVSIYEEDDKNFGVQKNKEYDGNDKNEKLFLEELIVSNYFVTKYSLKNWFYSIERMILSNINTKENYNKIFGSNKRFLIISLVLFLIFLVIICSMNENIIKVSSWILLPIVEYCFVRGMYLSPDTRMALKNLSFCLLCFAGIVLLPMMLISLLNGESFLTFLKVLPILIYILTIAFLGILVPVKSQYARELLGKILGFRRFLKVARKKELENMVMQNPNYFYDILPYAYVLGVSNKWIKKFETISMVAPNWDSSNSFGVRDSVRLYSKASRAMKSVPSISSGSGHYGRRLI